MADTATADELLRDVYGPGIINLLPSMTPGLTYFEDASDTADWSGRAVVKTIHASRNEGSGWAGERGAIPAAGSQGWTTKRVPMRYQYGRFEITAQALESTKGSRAAAMPLLEAEQSFLIKDMAAERGRAIWGDGRGVLALQNGAESGATLTVDAPAGYPGAQNGSKYLRPGRVFAILNPATGALRSSAVHRVATRASTGLTITTVGNVASAAADNDVLVTAANTSITDSSDTSWNKEIMGLLGMIDDGTYVATFHNVSRTNYPLYSSAVLSNIGPWSADAIQRAIDVTEQRSDGKISDMWMHHSGRRAYLSATEDQRRYIGADLSRPNMGTVAARGGKLAFGEVPINTDKYCHIGTIFGFDSSMAGFKKYSMKSGEWITSEGGSILRLVGTGSTLTHVYEAAWTIWENYDMEMPSAAFRADGLTVNAAVVPID